MPQLLIDIECICNFCGSPLSTYAAVDSDGGNVFKVGMCTCCLTDEQDGSYESGFDDGCVCYWVGTQAADNDNNNKENE